MKTDELLNLDCSKSCENWRENLQILRKALMQIPGVSGSNKPKVDMQSVEDTLHRFCAENDVRFYSILPIYENGKFDRYTVGFSVAGVQKTIIAHTLYVLMAKSLIYVYSVVRKGGKS